MLEREELVDRARKLVPDLRERAAETEKSRRLPEQTQRALVEAGLYRVYLPARYGGPELDFMLQVDIAAELGRACGSTSWVWSIVASHHWVQGMMDVRAQDAVWGEDPDALIASAFPAGGTVSRVAGGFVVDGTWSFSSGVDVCDWIHLNMFIPPSADEPAHHRFGLVRKADCEVVDDWFAAGLKGTGSKSLRFSEVFIPEHWTINSHKCVGGPTPGSAVNPNPLYRMPMFALFAHGIVGPAVGIALGVIDTVLAAAAGGRSRSGAALAQQQALLVRLAEATAEVDAARALLKVASDEGTAAATAGVTPPLTDRVRWRRDGAYAAHACLRAVQRLHPLAGANSLAEHNPFQRAIRDVHAVCAHIALTWDVQGANYGGVLLGQPSTDPKL